MPRPRKRRATYKIHTRSVYALKKNDDTYKKVCPVVGDSLPYTREGADCSTKKDRTTSTKAVVERFCEPTAKESATELRFEAG